MHGLQMQYRHNSPHDAANMCYYYISFAHMRVHTHTHTHTDTKVTIHLSGYVPCLCIASLPPLSFSHTALHFATLWLAYFSAMHL